MKLVVTGTRGIPDIMGGVETHCEELFPRIAAKGVDTTLIRRKDYVRDSLTEWKGVKLVDISAPKRKSYGALRNLSGGAGCRPLTMCPSVRTAGNSGWLTR